MVVIGVIALLIAVLVPTVSRAFAVARSTICQNNLSQIGSTLTIERADRLAKGEADGWRFQPADTWPGVLFTVVSDTRLIVCPEDSSDVVQTHMFGSPLSMMQYRNLTPTGSLTGNQTRGVSVNLDDAGHQGEGAMNVGTRKGSDQFGEYLEIKCDDNSRVYFDGDTHDGLLRLYTNKNGKTVIKLMNHTCGEYNAILYCGKPLFTNASDPPGVNDPASPMFGWMGPTSSGKIGMEVVLGATYKCSYGMAVGSQNLKFPSHKALVMDYVTGQVDPLNADTPENLRKSARHMNRLNVLYADGAVGAAAPWQFDPTITANANLWQP
jgi:prepilin-type processing-associated H-X9-DG protein